MLQIFQNFKDGTLEIADLPAPICKEGGILVKNVNSLISAGTEKMAIEFAKKSLLSKAKERPDLVKQVIKKFQKEGLKSTLNTVLSRLDTPLPLGYSSAGVVVESLVDEFRRCDNVACAGLGYASHAEQIFVPKNLAVKIPENVSFEEASYVTLGAIALQGIRVANLKLGETVVVIGLGLIGQIVVQLVKTSGCFVIGSDIDIERLKFSQRFNLDELATPLELKEKVQKFTKGRWADCVIITASSNSNEPIEIAGEISRLKGRVVVVGAVKMEIPRKIYYERELSVNLSMSYGPGRYDPNYEEKGIDYPYPYVPFTEKRNMETFLKLVSLGKIDVKSLTTHRFPIEEADKAYEIITKNSERYLGIILEYKKFDKEIKPLSSKIEISKKEPLKERKLSPIKVGIIGAGNFAKSVLIPNIELFKDEVTISAISTLKGLSAQKVGEKYKVSYVTSDYKEIIKDKEIDAIFIATRHNLHVPIMLEALKEEKPIFVEKPLAINSKELNELIKGYNEAKNPYIFVGFNRRFSQHSKRVKEYFIKRKSPLMIHIRVNAGQVPKDSWINDPKEGGGRIVGEVCHFVDLLTFLLEAKPVSLYADALLNEENKEIPTENLLACINFSDGSIGEIYYSALGDKFFPKERIEIFGEEMVGIIDDFRDSYISKGGKIKKLKSGVQDKGHKEEIKTFLESVKRGEKMVIPFEELVLTTLTTFKIEESIRLRKRLDIDFNL